MAEGGRTCNSLEAITKIWIPIAYPVRRFKIWIPISATICVGKVANEVHFLTQIVASVILFLASPLAGYMTGAVVHVNGGLLMAD